MPNLAYRENYQETPQGGATSILECVLSDANGLPVYGDNGEPCVLFRTLLHNYNLPQNGLTTFNFTLYQNVLLRLGMSEEEITEFEEFVQELLAPTANLALRQFQPTFHYLDLQNDDFTMSITLSAQNADVVRTYHHFDGQTTDLWHCDLGFLDYIRAILLELKARLNNVFSLAGTEESNASTISEEGSDDEEAAAANPDDAVSLEGSILENIDLCFDNIVELLNSILQNVAKRRLELHPEGYYAAEVSDPDDPSGPPLPELTPHNPEHSNLDSQWADRLYRLITASSLEYRDFQVIPAAAPAPQSIAPFSPEQKLAAAPADEPPPSTTRSMQYQSFNGYLAQGCRRPKRPKSHDGDSSEDEVQDQDKDKDQSPGSKRPRYS